MLIVALNIFLNERFSSSTVAWWSRALSYKDARGMCSNPVRGILLLIFLKFFFKVLCSKIFLRHSSRCVAHSSFFKIFTKIKFTMKSYTTKPREGVTEKQAA